MVYQYLLILVALSFVSLSQASVLIDGPEVDLTTDDMDKAILMIPEKIRPGVLLTPKKVRALMDSTYLAKVAASRAESRGLQNTPEVSAKIWHSTQNHLAAAEIRNFVSANLASDAGLESMARERYLIDKEDYYTEAEVEASHILIATSESMTDDAALAEAKRIYAEVKSGEIPFEEAARLYSQDKGSAKNGGALGKFGKGAMVKPFEQAVFSMQQVGDIHEPVKSRFGYHIIRLDGVGEPRLRSFDEVKGELITKLRAQQQQKLKENYLIEIRDDHRVKLDQPAIDAFLANPGASE